MNTKLVTLNRPRHRWFAFVVPWLMLASSAASARDLGIDWWSLNGGGGSSTGGAYTVSGLIGQSDAGSMSGGTFVLEGGISGGGAFSPVTNAAPLTVSKLQVKLNFAKANADSCTVKGTFSLPAHYSFAGKTVTLDLARVQVSFTLNSKGCGVGSQGTCRLTYKKRTGICTLTANLRRGDWQTSWTAYGLVNAIVSPLGVPLKFPVIVVVGDDIFAGEKALVYKCRPGKSGSAR
ncbi:MAG: hypothetical protein ABSH14_15290 [Verrucomicrobiia bacterium]|jgi:hypothetical protein